MLEMSVNSVDHYSLLKCRLQIRLWMSGDAKE